jgi:hypothetical protein
VEVVRQALEALKRRDRTSWLAVHGDDFELVPIRDFPEAAVRGPEAAWNFNLEAFEAFERVPIDEAELVDARPRWPESVPRRRSRRPRSSRKRPRARRPNRSDIVHAGSPLLAGMAVPTAVLVGAAEPPFQFREAGPS